MLRNNQWAKEEKRNQKLISRQMKMEIQHSNTNGMQKKAFLRGKVIALKTFLWYWS